jgi:hypothetical protein
MDTLTLQTFLSAGSDLESNQYKILGILKRYEKEFAHNRLYPSLAELIELVHTLELLLTQQSNFQQQLPRQIKEVDLRNKRLVFESFETTASETGNVLELVAWALPHIKMTIREGTRIYDFVDENISIVEVGILPVYREEGYYFIPEHRSALLHLVRYQVSLLSSDGERFRTLKTQIVQSVRQAPLFASPESIKLQLIEEHKELPNPATYICSTDLDFPFAETIFPIAKRKLMARLAA